MMNVAVVHNPKSGKRSPTREDICGSIEASGHAVAAYVSTEDPSWEQEVPTDVDLVVAAGGDGTVRSVFMADIASTTARTILALGTCNNVARTLRVPIDRPLSAPRMWRDGMVESRYHLPQTVSGGVEERCVEGAGAGVFAELIRRAHEGGADAADPWQLLREAIDDAPTDQWKVAVDGVDASGRFLAVVATVIQQTGPNLWIAPDADPSASQVTVVLVAESQRRKLAEYAERRGRGEQPPRVAFDVVRGRRLAIEAPDGVSRSVDDATLEGGESSLTVRASDKFVHVLAPRERGADSS
jgi:diacylglycerol kinase (ATP)